MDDGELGMVVRELSRLGKAIEMLGQEMRDGLTEMRAANDKRVEALETRLRTAEIELAKVTTKISVAVAIAGAVGAGLVELVRAVGH